jgi:hypothetical protein
VYGRKCYARITISGDGYSVDRSPGILASREPSVDATWLQKCRRNYVAYPIDATLLHIHLGSLLPRPHPTGNSISLSHEGGGRRRGVCPLGHDCSLNHYATIVKRWSAMFKVPFLWPFIFVLSDFLLLVEGRGHLG